MFSELAGSAANVHAGNMTSIRLTNDGLIITGGADRAIEVSKLSGGEDGSVDREHVRSLLHHDAPVLSLDVHPTNQTLLLSGDMAGKVRCA